MSVSVNVVARKRLSSEEQRLIEARVTLARKRIKVPPELEEITLKILGHQPKYWDSVEIGPGEFVEVGVYGKGDVMCYDGMVLKLKDLPEGTEELRIYASP